MLLNLCKVLGVMNQERATRPHSLEVRTRGFHPRNVGSIPAGVTWQSVLHYNKSDDNMDL